MEDLVPEKLVPLTVEAALEAVLARFAPLEAVEVPLTAALGRVLAADVVAEEDLPPFAHAAMDGYAVRGADVATARRDAPVRLRVLGEVAAGHTSALVVAPGTALRIMTGAPLPAGADAVVPREQTVTDAGAAAGEGVQVLAAVRAGRHVRPAGEDARRGEKVLVRGLRLRPPEVGLLAALGRPCVPVTRRPRVALLATGDELVGPGEPRGPGQIYSSNAYALHAQVLACGGEPLPLPSAPDRLPELSARLDQGLAWGVDLFITTGGVSMGKYDLVKELLADRGRIDFWQVQMQPGRPTAFGEVAGVPLLGLPGNPASALVAFLLLGRPAILKMLGQRALRLPEVTAVLLEDARGYSDRRRYVRAIVEEDNDRYTVRLTGPQGAGLVTSLVRANGLAIIPEGTCPAARAGTTVRVLMVDWPEVE